MLPEKGKELIVAIPFKWGQVFQLIGNQLIVEAFVKSQSLLNEVKYSNGLLGVQIEFRKERPSQSLLNEVKYSNFLSQKELQNVDVMSQSLLNEVKYSNVQSFYRKPTNESVAIPFKWGQVFQLKIGNGIRIEATVSQSLLNEVKYSNFVWKKILKELKFQSQSLLNEVKYSNFVHKKNCVPLPFGRNPF